MEKLYNYYKEYFNKSDLYEYLDIYTFVGEDEIYLAICDFLDAKLDGVDREGVSNAQLFAKEYIKDRKLNFNSEENGLTRDTEGIIEQYEDRIEQLADFYAESY